MKPKVMVLYGEGLNCEKETEHSFNTSGADTKRVLIQDMVKNSKMIKDYQIIAFPGGFLHGDSLGAGRLMGAIIRKYMLEDLQRFIEDDRLVIGICNGFQVLAHAGLLPRLNGRYGERKITLTDNGCGRFRDYWVHLKTESEKCVWTKGIERLYLPVRHGEGRFVTDGDTLKSLYEQDLVALKYVPGDGLGDLPYNPNDSQDDIAGICDPTGRIFGLMPHPEAYNHKTNHPRWTREELPEEGLGLQVYKNGVKYFE